MKIRFLLAILLCQLIPPSSASSAVFTFTSPDLPASIQGEASILNSGNLAIEATMSNASINSTLQPDSKSKIALQTGFGRLPLSFEVNQGQTDAEVKFLSRGKGYTLFLTPKEAVLSLKRGQYRSRMLDVKSVPSLAKSHKLLPKSSQSATDIENPAVLRIKLIGANPQPDIVGLEELPGKVNYFLGNDPKKWRTKISTFTKVKYKDVYPGIDLVYYGNQGQLEYDFVVAPGADPKMIKFEIKGAEKLELNARGDLLINTGHGEIRQYKPLVYQEISGSKQIVSGQYVLKEKHEVGFQVAMYDASKPLVIDPVLSYSTFLGGSGFNDVGIGVAVDATGAVYVTGATGSPDFPIVDALQPTIRALDVFVAKFTPDGTALVYSTFLGGSVDDEGIDIALDADGAAYITGDTNSIDFPTINAVQPTFGGGIRPGPIGGPAPDAFVAKLMPDGTGLVYSTYLGGSSTDFGASIVLDAAGAAYVTGETLSPDFPTVRALQPSLAGFSNAFVAKFTPNGTAVVYSTYLGGSNSDSVSGIAVNAAGEAHVIGSTFSRDFPTVRALQPTFTGTHPVFVAKFAADGAALIYSTYLGGSGNDTGQGIAVDAAGYAYVTGDTDSPDFPIVHALQPTYGGFGLSDGFVAKLTADGTELIYSTYLGGRDNDNAAGIAVDAAGAAYVTGGTASPDFPIVNALQPTLRGGADAFVAKLTPDGAALVHSTYLGGSMDDGGNDIAVNADGDAYITGGTNSPDFPTIHAIQPALGGTHDAFVAKLIPSHIVNDLLTFIPIESTFNSGPNILGCPSGFVGEFSFSATLTNNTSSTVSNLVANVTTLSNGNLLQNADGGPGGVGNTLTIPIEGNFSDGLLSPGEFVDVSFSICLKNLESFDFFVDVHVLEESR